MALTAGMLIAPVEGKTGGSRQVGLSTLITNLPMQELSAEEEIGLTKMREEEKLARDVYQVLYDRWKQPIFKNIMQSEQQHMAAIKVLLDKYDRPDPVADSIAGVFVDPELQELYTSLIDQGRLSPTEAFYVGATIEDLDIKDLSILLEQTDNSDIRTVYQNLSKGSRNHLRAFVTQLSLNGKSYEAQFLSSEQVRDIVTSPKEKGAVDEDGNRVSGNSRQRRGR